MLKRPFSLLLALACLICCLQPMQVFAAENDSGWVERDGNLYYIYPENGEYAYGTVAVEGKLCRFDDFGRYIGTETAGWLLLGVDTYYVVDDEGNIAIGWKKIGGYWYYFNKEGHMQIGWLTLGDKTYYLDPSGSMVIGKYTIDGETHTFDSNGVWQGGKPAQTGWVKEGDYWYYYLTDGTLATGFMDIGANSYCFDNQGRMLTGWIQWKPYSYMEIYRYFYANKDGAFIKGWQQIGGVWYYFYKDGHMAVDTYIDNYYINTSGIWSSTVTVDPIRDYYGCCTEEQAAQADAIAKSIAQDALKNGGASNYEKIKYAAKKVDAYIRKAEINTGDPVEDTPYGIFVAGVESSKGRTMAMGRVLDFMDFVWYENSTSFNLIWWICLKMDGEYGYVIPLNGEVAFGNYSQDPPYIYDYSANLPQNTQGQWLQQNGKTYFVGGNGKTQTGWRYIDNNWYYFCSDGTMKTGWLQDGGKWYYLNANGTMKTGWLQQGRLWYFLQKDGSMATGRFRNLGDYYYADQNGVMLTGWRYIGGKWYYMKNSGVMVRGLATIGGVAYYFNEKGQMAVGWAKDSKGDWFYARSNGALIRNTWHSIGKTYYYFYRDGHMAEQTYIDNYFIDANGAWVSTVSVNRDPQHYKGLTAQQATQADTIAKAIAQDALANGGDTDLKKITYAAKIVAGYVDQCVYQNDANSYYRSPYGVFVAGVYTCAGSTRAMGRVLEYMGYKWYHPGENQWDHQWVCVKMDGEYGWVEPQLGIAGYGNFEESYNPFK